MLKNFCESILALIIGHLTVFKHAFKKRVTLEYPEVMPFLNEKFRGKHVFDVHKCKACGICQKVCPANAITLTKKGNAIEMYSIDYNKCIFCGNCCYYCGFKAITMSTEFELASVNKQSLKRTFIKSEENDE